MIFNMRFIKGTSNVYYYGPRANAPRIGDIITVERKDGTAKTVCIEDILEAKKNPINSYLAIEYTTALSPKQLKKYGF